MIPTVCPPSSDAEDVEDDSVLSLMLQINLISGDV
jgi:hypothetical protein